MCLLGLTGRALKYAKSGAGEGSRKGFFVSVAVSVSVSLSVSISLRLHSSLFFVHVVVAFALALFVGLSCCCFFHSPSRLSDFQVMSFFCCPPLGWTVLLMDCCQVKVMSYVGVCPCVCECAGMWVWGRALFILQGLLSKSPRLRPAHKASHEIQFVSIICLIFIR